MKTSHTPKFKHGTVKVAYSYVRFSTPDQRFGDSLRRQVQAAENWCEKNGMVLDTSLRDEGISGYRGKNATHGALATFLKAIRIKRVAPGSILIVESLDRLSRDEPMEGLDLIREIIGAGVRILTLQDNMIYSEDSLRDLLPLMQALMIMSRSHEESRTKADRLSASWQQKRKDAQSGRPMTRLTPAWIQVKGAQMRGNRNDWSKARFELIPDRAALVRDIFEKRSENWSYSKIAEHINEAGIEPWGRGRRKSKWGWHSSYIKKIAQSRTVLGEFQAHRIQQGRGSKRVPIEDPIPDFYPRLVSDELWHAVQAKNKGTPVSRGRPGRSFLGHLLFDAKGAPLHIKRKGAGLNYVATSPAARRKDQPDTRWRLEHIETCLLALIQEIDWRSVYADESSASRLDAIETKLAAIQHETAEIDRKVAKAAEAFFDETEFADAVRARAAKLEVRKRELMTEQDRLLVEKAQLERTMTETPVAQVRGELSDPEVSRRINADLRSMIAAITLYPSGQVPGRIDESNHAAAVAVELDPRSPRQDRKLGGCGALQIDYRNGKSLIAWVTYRPADRSKLPPRLISVLGSGISASAQERLLHQILSPSLGVES